MTAISLIIIGFQISTFTSIFCDRYLYWIDNSTGNAKISRASMDGTNVETLHSERVKSPTALTIDYETQTIYWIDSHQRVLEMSNVDGSNRTELAKNISTSPFSMDIFDGFIYWSDNIDNTIYYAPVSSPTNITALTHGLSHSPQRLRVVSSKKQPMPSKLFLFFTIKSEAWF